MGEPTVLIAEEEALIALDLSSRVTRFGYEVVGVVPSGERAVAAAFERRPDVILMDVHLEGKTDGIDAANEIHRRLDIPVLFLTANADERSLERVTADGSFGCLLKPVNERELEVALATAIHRSGEVRHARETEGWLQSILRGVSDAVIGTSGGKIRYLNAAAEQLTGWTKEEAAGLDLAHVLQTKERTSSAARMTGHATLVARDGSERAIEIEHTDLPDGAELSVFRDVGERQRAGQVLRESEERFRLLVDAVKDYAIYMLDPEGRIVSWNTGAQLLKGYTADEVISKNFSIFYPEQDRAAGRPEHALKVAAEQGRFEGQGWRVRKDGSRFWADVVLSAVWDAAGELVGFAKVTRDMTERRRAEEERWRGEAKFRALAASAIDAVITSSQQGLITYMNHGGEAMFGYSEGEAIGQPLSVLMPARYRERAQHGIETFLATGESTIIGKTTQLSGLRRDGTEFPLEISISAWKAGGEYCFGASLRDVTDRIRAEQALAESEERTRLALLSAKLGVWDYHPLTGELTNDERARELCGLPSDVETTYEMWLATIHPEDRQRVLDALRPPVGGDIEVECRTIGPRDGIERWISLHGRVSYDEEGRRVRSLGTIADITEHHHVEELRERLTGILAHDLRGPLSVIAMTSQMMLRQGNLTAESLKGAGLVARNADRMTRMIEQLMDYTRARFGEGLLGPRERLDLAALCREAVADAEAANPGRRVLWVAHGDCVGMWCPTSLARVFANLISNAIQHGSPDCPIEIRLRDEGAEVVLEVCNQGEPILVDDQRIIFDPFRRAGQASQKPTRCGAPLGLGLGLYIARGIVLAHGGQIGIRSTQELGTIFTVRLPRGMPSPG